LASSLAERAFLALAKSRDLDRFAMKAVLKASELLGFALGHRLRALRDSQDPLQAAFAEGQENLLLAHFYLELSEILASRWDKIPDKKRPQYTPEQRYRILSLKKLFVSSAEETAKRFRVSAETIARWERDAESRNLPSSDRPLVRPNPPVRRYADVVRQLVPPYRGY